MTKEEDKKTDEFHTNGRNDSKDKETRKNEQKKTQKKAKVKECVGNLVVLNKIQGSLLTHLKTDLEEINCI